MPHRRDPRQPPRPPPVGGLGGLGLPPDYQWGQHGERVNEPGPGNLVHPPPVPGGGRGLDPDQCALAEAFAFALDQGALVRNEPVPTAGEPYRATTLQLFRRGVIAPDAATDADANAGAIAAGVASISTGTSPPEGIFLLFTPTPSNAFVLVASFRVPRGHAFVAKSLQTTVFNAVARHYTRWRVSVSRSPVTDNLELGAFTGSVEGGGRLFGVAHENEAVTVEAANHDLQSGVMFEVLLTGWFFPVLQADDSLKSLYLGSERGPDARRFDPTC